MRFLAPEFPANAVTIPAPEVTIFSQFHDFSCPISGRSGIFIIEKQNIEEINPKIVFIYLR